MAAVGWGQAPTALRLGWTRVGRNRLIYYLHFPYYIKGFIYRPDYNCPLHKLSNLLNLTNPIYWKYLLSNRIFELNLNLPILSPICALGRTRHDDLDHTSSWSWPELVPIKSGHLPRTLHTLPRFVVPRRRREYSPPCWKGRPGAVVRTVSLSHQVAGSKQPLRRFCGGKVCLGFSLPQTPLMWEPSALGLPCPFFTNVWKTWTADIGNEELDQRQNKPRR